MWGRGPRRPSELGLLRTSEDLRVFPTRSPTTPTPSSFVNSLHVPVAPTPPTPSSDFGQRPLSVTRASETRPPYRFQTVPRHPHTHPPPPRRGSSTTTLLLRSYASSPQCPRRPHTPHSAVSFPLFTVWTGVYHDPSLPFRDYPCLGTPPPSLGEGVSLPGVVATLTVVSHPSLSVLRQTFRHVSGVVTFSSTRLPR